MDQDDRDGGCDGIAVCFEAVQSFMREPKSRGNSSRPKKIAYFVHDLSDAAVHRRVRMMVAGGAAVTPIGFRRQPNPVRDVEGIAAIDLGRTEDGRLSRRLISVVGALLTAGRLAEPLDGADVILARNLEMLTIASRARKLHAPRARLVHECLDVHRLLLSPRPEGRLLRRTRIASVAWRRSVVDEFSRFRRELLRAAPLSGFRPDGREQGASSRRSGPSGERQAAACGAALAHRLVRDDPLPQISRDAGRAREPSGRRRRDHPARPAFRFRLPRFRSGHR